MWSAAAAAKAVIWYRGRSFDAAAGFQETGPIRDAVVPADRPEHADSRCAPWQLRIRRVPENETPDYLFCRGIGDLKPCDRVVGIVGNHAFDVTFDARQPRQYLQSASHVA